MANKKSKNNRPQANNKNSVRSKKITDNMDEKKDKDINVDSDMKVGSNIKLDNDIKENKSNPLKENLFNNNADEDENEDMFKFLDEINIDKSSKSYNNKFSTLKKETTIKDSTTSKRDVVTDCRRVLKEKHRPVPQTTMKEDFIKNKVLWYILGGLVIVLIIALVVTNVHKTKSKDSEKHKIIQSETTTTAEEETTTGSNLPSPESEDSKILELVKNYLKAERIDVSMDELSKYVDNVDNIEISKYSTLSKYIEEYQNINCYVLNSISEDTYIVVTTYGCKFYNIETAAPGCETLLVVKKDEQYLVHNLTVKETIDTYISSDVDVTIINQISKEINDNLEASMTLDSDLANVINVLSGN